MTGRIHSVLTLLIVDDLLGSLVYTHDVSCVESMPKQISVLSHTGLMSADLAVVDDLLGRCVLALWEFELGEVLRQDV